MEQKPALLEGRTDITMSAMSVTKQRAVRIAFSSPYYRTGLPALPRRKDRTRSPTGCRGIAGQVPSLRFGVFKGATGEQLVRQNFGRADKIRAQHLAGSGKRPDNRCFWVNRIDVLIHDGPVPVMRAAADEPAKLCLIPKYLTEEYPGWRIRKKNPQLLESTNGVIEKLKQQGRLASMIWRWIPFAQ